ncbi:MAG: cytochrome c biogenesis heme-transporting ATPase CcmA [Nitrospiraceae bacterium]|nr:cytochrome c biogenesis heme-transporting ATPase CcmA [Nitrospiraceae bacterium]
MLEAVQLGCNRGDRRVFSDLRVTVGPGQILTVLGENGSGKSSFLRALCGLLTPDEGRVLWHGTDIAVLGEQYRMQVAYLGHLNGTKDDLTPMENLHITMSLDGHVPTDGELASALEAVGIGAKTRRLATQVLSQGQKRRVALARLWLTGRPVWILDEPFTSLDAAATRLVTDRLSLHLERGGSIVVATHQELDLPTIDLRCLRLAG